MRRQTVSSSNIRSIGYETTTGTLEVEFNSGGIYQYFNVPEAVYSALMHASSKGAYVNDYIKDQYRCQKAL